MEKVRVQIDWCGNYCACAEGVDGCVSTGDTLEGVKRRYAEALAFHIQGYKDESDPLPEAIAGQYEFEYILSVSALLHSLDGILTRKAMAKVTGINEKLLTQYASGQKRPRTIQRKRIVDGIRALGRDLMNIE